MQTIYLDISNKGVIQTIYAKQGDVGRKFEVILNDSGLPYVPTSGSAFSVWYSGTSGEGNYTDIGDKSAFSVNGNKVAVEMISQMLLNDGDGVLSLALNDPNGNQISTWNIPYVCESVPGANSEEAKSYYTAFSKAVEGLPYPDASLSVPGKAADAAAVGTALAGKASAGSVLTATDPNNDGNIVLQYGGDVVPGGGGSGGSGGSGIHIGAEPPTDENVEVWIDTDEEPETGGGIDVTAEAGQTIIVKAVDENGKPTEWESADYQPRTHWEEKDATVIQDETVLTFSDNMAMVQGLIPIVPGEVYTVYFDGVPYDCRCRRSSYMGYADYVLGNEGIIGAGLNTGEPFVVGVIPAMSAWGVFVPDTDLTHTIKITQSKINPLDIRYYDNSFCVTVTHESYTQEEGSTYSVKETAEEILRAYHNGKNMTCNLIVQKGKFAYEYFLALSKSVFMSDQGYGVVSLMFNGVYNQDYEIRVVSVNVPLVISPTLGIGDIIVDGYSTDAESFNPYVSA